MRRKTAFYADFSLYQNGQTVTDKEPQFLSSEGKSQFKKILVFFFPQNYCNNEEKTEAEN